MAAILTEFEDKSYGLLIKTYDQTKLQPKTGLPFTITIQCDVPGGIIKTELIRVTLTPNITFANDMTTAIQWRPNTKTWQIRANTKGGSITQITTTWQTNYMKLIFNELTKPIFYEAIVEIKNSTDVTNLNQMSLFPKYFISTTPGNLNIYGLDGIKSGLLARTYYYLTSALLERVGINMVNEFEKYHTFGGDLNGKIEGLLTAMMAELVPLQITDRSTFGPDLGKIDFVELQQTLVIPFRDLVNHLNEPLVDREAIAILLRNSATLTLIKATILLREISEYISQTTSEIVDQTTVDNIFKAIESILKEIRNFSTIPSDINNIVTTIKNLETGITALGTKIDVKTSEIISKNKDEIVSKGDQIISQLKTSISTKGEEVLTELKGNTINKIESKGNESISKTKDNITASELIVKNNISSAQNALQDYIKSSETEVLTELKGNTINKIESKGNESISKTKDNITASELIVKNDILSARNALQDYIKSSEIAGTQKSELKGNQIIKDVKDEIKLSDGRIGSNVDSKINVLTGVIQKEIMDTQDLELKRINDLKQVLSNLHEKLYDILTTKDGFDFDRFNELKMLIKNIIINSEGNGNIDLVDQVNELDRNLKIMHDDLLNSENGKINNSILIRMFNILKNMELIDLGGSANNNSSQIITSTGLRLFSEGNKILTSNKLGSTLYLNGILINYVVGDLDDYGDYLVTDDNCILTHTGKFDEYNICNNLTVRVWYKSDKEKDFYVNKYKTKFFGSFDTAPILFSTLGIGMKNNGLTFLNQEDNDIAGVSTNVPFSPNEESIIIAEQFLNGVTIYKCYGDLVQYGDYVITDDSTILTDLSSYTEINICIGLTIRVWERPILRKYYNLKEGKVFIGSFRTKPTLFTA